MSAHRLFRRIGFAAATLLLASLPAQAQTGGTKKLVDIRPFAVSGGTSPRTLSLVLLSGDTAGTTGTAATDEVPAAARKALDDLKGFLPFTAYRLHDTSVIAAPSATVPAMQRLRGPDGQLFEVSVSQAASGARSLEVLLREVSTDPKAPQGAAPASVLAATVQLTAGETIVVGTSRVRGDKALILLLTGIPSPASTSSGGDSSIFRNPVIGSLLSPSATQWKPLNRAPVIGQLYLGPQPPAPAAASTLAPAGDVSFADALSKSVTVAFDMSKTVTLTGVVETAMTELNREARSFRIMHQGNGTPATWTVLVRKDGKSATIKPGDTVQVTGWPARDGSRRLESSMDRIRPATK